MNRTTKTASKTATARAIPHEEAHTHADPSTWDGIYARFTEAQDAMLKFMGTPGWKRSLIATVTWFASITLGALAISAIVEGLIVSAIIGGTSMFIACTIAVLAAVIGAKVVVNFATRVAGAILTKEADERALAAYDAVRKFTVRINPFAKKAV
jgi:hypothetical protein